MNEPLTLVAAVVLALASLLQLSRLLFGREVLASNPSIERTRRP